MATSIEKNTAKLMLGKLQTRLNDLYNEQETLKDELGLADDGSQEYCRGGRTRSRRLPKKQGGGLLQGMGKSLLKEGIPALLQGLGTSGSNKQTFNPQLAPMDYKSNYLQGLGWDPQIPVDSSTLAYGNQIPAQLQSQQGFWGRNQDTFKEIGYGAASLAPSIYNMVQGLQRPEQMKASDFYNPYLSDIRSTMRGRRYNVEPMLEANRTAFNISSRNLRNLGSASSGNIRGNLGVLQSGRMRGDQAALAEQQNWNNRYLGEQAQMDAMLGRDMSAINWQTADWNAASRAARRNYIGTSLTGVSQYAQLNRLMSNQEQADVDRAGILKDSSAQMLQWMPEINRIIDEKLAERERKD